VEEILENVEMSPHWVLFGSFFMISNFYPLDLQNGTCVAIENVRGARIRVSKLTPGEGKFHRQHAGLTRALNPGLSPNIIEGNMSTNRTKNGPLLIQYWLL